MLKKICLFLFLSVATFATYIGVYFNVPRDNMITYLEAELTVPPKPNPRGTLFVWPGLQPGGANYQPIGNGVLQSVLTWGRSCAPTPQPPAHTNWWISGQYVNTIGNYPGYTGCKSGPAMSVNPGDKLKITYSLSGTTWLQTVYNMNGSQCVTYKIDMKNQSQNGAYFLIELTDGAVLGYPAYFNNIVIVCAKPLPTDRSLIRKNNSCQLTNPVFSDGNKKCTISEMILRE